jgi:hypothetical protein
MQLVGSDGATTATRERVPDEVAPDAHVGTAPSSAGPSPFAGGATRIANVRQVQLMALQRLAGNAAVAHLVTRRQTVQRAPRPKSDPVDPSDLREWESVKALGDDPMGLVTSTVDLFEALDTIKPDADFTGDPKVFAPVGAGLMFEDFIVIVDRSATPVAVMPQSDPPQMLNQSVVGIHESATTHLWLLFMDKNGQIRASPRFREGVVPVKGAPPGRSRLLIFIPGMSLTEANADLLRKRIPGSTGSGKPGQPPDWAKDQLKDLKKRRAKAGTGEHGGPGGVEGGKGLGREDKGGTGGGGLDDDPDAVPGGDGLPKKKDGVPGAPPVDPGDPKKPKMPGAGTGASSSHAPGKDPAPGEKKTGDPGEKGEPGTGEKRKPLQGDPTFKVGATKDGDPFLIITLDRATTTIGLQEGEKGGTLDGRIDKAIEQLQQSRDPELHGKVVHPATSTGFKQVKGVPGTVVPTDEARKQAKSGFGATTPGERIPGAKGGANTPGYPAKITMGGNKDAAPVTVNGATNAFTMEIDYAAMSFGLQDEVFNRMQTIQFYWELLDVTGKTLDEQKAVAKTAKVGSGDAIGAGSGDARNIGRTVDNIAEDERNDLEMMDREDWAWESRAAYLTVIGVSNAVRMVGSLISSYIAIVTRPLNERSIGFDREGEFVVRCVATPEPSDAALADPDNHIIRASSIAAQPVKVMNINKRAQASINEEDQQLAKLEAGVKDAKDDKERSIASAKLEAARKATAQAGQAAYKSSVGGIREQLATARLLKKHFDEHKKDSELSAPELYLEIALEQRNIGVEEMIAQLEKQLTTMAGEGAEKGEGQGEHEQWVAKQAGTFKNGVEYRPRVVLASEETGQVTPVLMMLGEAKASTDKHPKWQLIDITSPSARDIYEGESKLEGPAGHSAAIRDAFVNFREKNEYGRGTIAIRLPAQLTSQPAYAGATVEPLMRSAKGGWGRFKERLTDLATAAEVVGLFVTGPIGAAVAAVGGVAGAIVAVDSLVKRARTGHVWEVGTIFDVLGVVGGVASVGGFGAALGRAHIDRLAAEGGKMPSWVSKLEKTEKALHIHGMIGNLQQIIVIPYQTIEELNGIEGGTDGERDARRALALLRGIKSGAITVISATGGIKFEEKAPAPSTDIEPAGPKQLPAGTNAGVADAHAGGTGPAKAPTQPAPDAAGGAGGKPAREGGAAKADTDAKTGASTDVKTPSSDQVLAHALELARARARASAEAVSEDVSGKPAKPAEATGGGTDTGTGGTKPGTGADAAGTGAKPEGPTEAAGTGPKPSIPTTEGGVGSVPEKGGTDAVRLEAMIGLAAKAGAKPDKATQEVRTGATKNAAAADPDAVNTLKDTGKFGQLRRDVESMGNMTDAQRSALKSRLQEARLAVTNEQVGKILGKIGNEPRFAELEFHVQDLGTVGFASDRDITIKVTPKDAAAYAKMSPEEQARMDRLMVLASAEAVPELYKALEAAGFPAERSLDTNFYTELHEGRVKPANAAEATQIAADQQIVSMTEIILNTSHEQWQAFVDQQRAMIEGLRAQKTPEADIAKLKERLEGQIATAQEHAKNLVGDAGGHPTADVRNAALGKARDALGTALQETPPPSARRLRQLMADVKLLEPDAYGTRGAVESVVLGGQAMKSATMENVQKEGFRTRRQIEHGEGEPGPQRLDPKTGELSEVAAEDEVGRRRAEASPNVGARRPGTADESAYEANVRHLNVAQAVAGHLLGHMPDPAHARPTDTSTAAKNLGRIVVEVTDAGIRTKGGGLDHLPAIVAAKGAAEPIGAIHKELAAWAREGNVKGWAETNGVPLATDADRVAAFVGWSREQAMNLTGRLRIRTETGAVHGDIEIGTGRSAPASSPGSDAGGGSGPKGDAGTETKPTKPMPGGEAPVDANESSSAPTATAKADAPKVEEGGGAGKLPPGGTQADIEDDPSGQPKKGAPPVGSTGATPLPSAHEQAQAEAAAEIQRLRARLYRWRASTNDPATLLQIQEHLDRLTQLAKANRAQESEAVEGALKGIREDIPAQRRVLKPVEADQVEALRKRVFKLRNRTDPGETRDAYDRILRDIDGLQERMKKNPNADARTSYDSIRKDVARTGREDYEVHVPLTDPVVRAEMYAWFADHLAPLAETEVGKVLHDTILKHIDTADDLLLQQSPRGAGTGASSTAAMRKEVLAAVKAKRYSPEYTAAFELAARGHDDGWPRDQNGVVWEVDHVAELWLGGADDVTNFLALPFAIHTTKSEILSEFRSKYRDKLRVDGEESDVRNR